MQKLFNDPGNVVDDSIRGFVKCHRDYLEFAGNPRVLKYTYAPTPGKVGIVSGGGFGHDPAFMGFVGENMLDAVAIGDIFKPPSPKAFYEAMKAADSGNGVVCVYGNYPADIESVNKASAMAESDGIMVRSVISSDDVAITDEHKNRGMTGEVLLWKISSAAAALGYGLDEVTAVTKKAAERTRSVGIGLKSCIIPDAGRPNYLIEAGTMEIGVGHHGQSSKDTMKLKKADESADIMVDEILRYMQVKEGDTVSVMISGLGSTMLSELNIVYSRVDDALRNRGIDIYRPFVGNFFTSLDMMGVTLTLMHLDDELAQLLDLPAYPVALKYFG